MQHLAEVYPANCFIKYRHWHTMVSSALITIKKQVTISLMLRSFKYYLGKVKLNVLLDCRVYTQKETVSTHYTPLMSTNFSFTAALTTCYVYACIMCWLYLFRRFLTPVNTIILWSLSSNHSKGLNLC